MGRRNDPGAPRGVRVELRSAGVELDGTTLLAPVSTSVPAGGTLVLRGANAPDAVPHNESRLTDEVAHRYGRPLAEVSEAWRPYRTWAAVHLRVLRERRLAGEAPLVHHGPM